MGYRAKTTKQNRNQHHPESEHRANISLFPNSYVSPRKRAQRTLELLDIGCRERMPWQDPQTSEAKTPLDVKTNAKVQITEDIREWDYGDYEGKRSKQIAEERERDGAEKWDIWRDGCPGGE